MSVREGVATLNVRLDSAKGVPLYRQLAEQLRGLIHSGRLQAGERLPSSRQLAQELGISRTSTLSAYEQLIAEALLVTRPGAGVFVTRACQADASSLWAAANESQPPVVGLEPLPAAGQPGPTAEASELFDAGPDIDQFPFGEWARCLARVWRHPDTRLLRDRHPGGYWPLRQAVARYLKVMRDIHCRPEQIVITAGNRDALSLIAHLLLGPGGRVWLENPGYPPLAQGLIAAGAQLQHCPVDEEGMCLPASGTSAELAWMTPSRQYPLGISMSAQRRLDWLDISRRQGCWLVEDDYDSEYHYRKAPMASLFSLDQQQRVILVGSFSKVMFRTLRIGYLVAPEPLLEPLLAVQERLGSLASMPVQPALAEFLGHRRFSTHLRRMRRCYQQRRDFLYQQLQSRLSQYLHTELPANGMHLVAWLRPEVAVTDLWLVGKLAEQQIQAQALSRHYSDDKPQGLLLGFSGCDEAQLARGVEVLARLLNAEG